MTTVAQARPLAPDSGSVLRPLDQIARELRREHELCEAASRRALEHAFRCGDLLIEAKAQLGHGDWLPWLEGNFAGSDRTARGYMQLARGSDEERRSLADMGIHKALKELAAPRPARPIGQALREELGSTDGAMDELGLPALEPERRVNLRSGVAGKTWRDIAAALGRAECATTRGNLARETVRDVRGLPAELLADELRDAAAYYRDAIAEHEEVVKDLLVLADHVVEIARR